VKAKCLRVGLGVGEEVHKVENAAVGLAEERQLELLLIEEISELSCVVPCRVCEGANTAGDYIRFRSRPSKSW
jgi:hypothetical protein